jgi:hypothetical protein
MPEGRRILSCADRVFEVAVTCSIGPGVANVWCVGPAPALRAMQLFKGFATGGIPAASPMAVCPTHGCRVRIAIEGGRLARLGCRCVLLPLLRHSYCLVAES